MKIGLPRKRKKEYKKKHGKGNYLAVKILCELLQEEGRKNATKFAKSYSEDKRKVLSYY